MLLGKLYATAMVGLFMGALPFAATAQTSDTTMDGESGAMFVTIVQGCVDAPNISDCGQVRVLITECAVDLDPELCDVLFERPNDVFADLHQQEQAQVALAETSEAIASMDFEEADSEIGDAIEATRANAERTMLRGDENLNSHSSPPLAVEN